MLIRVLRGKEDYRRLNERLGYSFIKRPSGKLIWFHAASVGESLSILPLIEYFVKEHSRYSILVTTGTRTSADLMKKKLPKNVIHQYIPTDDLFSVKRFIKFWKPSLAFFTESEFWPNLIFEISKSCNLILLNGRVSDKSFVKWQKKKIFIKKILECFSLIFAQSEQDFQRLKILGAKKIFLSGNIKYSSISSEVNKEELSILTHSCSERIVFMAASTHKNEEDQIAKCHINLRKKHIKLLTIIAPRHPQRLSSILEEVGKNKNLLIAIRSKNDLITAETDIYIVDTIGELGMFYRLAEYVFIGGSLVPHGGHNILEPAMLNNIIFYGPHMHNFREISEKFIENNAAIICNDANELQKSMETILDNENLKNSYKKNAKKVVDSSKDILVTIIKKIEPFLYVD